MEPPVHFAQIIRSQRIARGALAAALTLLALWTLRSFLPALAWAVVFAIATWPLYHRAQRRWPAGRHSILLPLGFTVAIASLFIAPLALVAVQVASEAHTVLHWIEDARRTGVPVPDWVSHLPVGSQLVGDWWRDNLSSPASAADLLQRSRSQAQLATFSRDIGAQLIHRLTLFGFTILTLFFLFRDGERLADQLVRASRRAFGPRGERVGRQMIASIHGTVDGLVLVGIGEGLLLGIAYAIAGVPRPTLLGALTAVAAMIPFGAPLAFGTAALLLLVQGSAVAAILILACGLVVTFVADHFVRPVLIGGSTRLPFLWVLLGILGGVETWGLLGLFLGPAIMAALMLLWREWVGEPREGVARSRP